MRPAIGASRADLQRRPQQSRVGHLRGHRALPDQFVETRLVWRQRQRLRPLAEVGRPDRFVRFLGVLDLGLVLPGAAVEGVAVHVLDRPCRLAQRLLAEGRRVGAVIRDDAVLEQPLRRTHGAVGGKPQLAVGFLLQRRRGERRRWPLRRRLLLDARHRPRQPAGQRVAHRLGGGFIEQADVAAHERTRGRVEVLAGGDAFVADADEGRHELRLAGAQLRIEVPVGAAAEGAALFLALHDQPHRNALHASGAESGLHLLPEHRREHVAVQPIEDAAALLGIDQLQVDVAGRGDRVADRFLGDLVEHDPLDRALGLEHLAEMPADGLAFAIGVGSQQHFRRVLDGRLQLPDPRLPVRRHDVVRLEAIVHVHTDAAPGLLLDGLGHLAGVLGQIPHVPHAGLDPELVAQEPGQRLGLSG